MKLEDPVALRFIMEDDVYLLNSDKKLHHPIAPVPQSIETPVVKFNYLGGNKKNFLVVVYYPNHEFMEEIHLTALESTLTRLGLKLEDTAILNRAKYPEASYSMLTDYFKPQKMLLLGKNALAGHMETITLNKLKLLNNCRTLFTSSFGEMMDSTEYKKAFWEQMKQL